MLFRLTTFELEHAPKYRCLSYVWGVEEWHPISVRVDEDAPYRTLHISRNLTGFLHRLRLDPTDPNYFDGYFWLDSLCINQGDMAEKANQIPSMGRIYSQSEQVIAWLGWEWDARGNGGVDPENHYYNREYPAADAVSAIAQIATAFREYRDHGGDPWKKGFDGYVFDQEEMYRMLQLPKISTKAWKALALLFQRAWLSRAWVIQEAVLARSMHILCGWKVLEWDDLLQATIFLYASSWYQMLAHLNPLTTDMEVQMSPGFQLVVFGSLRQYIHHGEAHTADLGPLQPFYLKGLNVYEVLAAIMRSTRNFVSTEPKDKIFAPLALLREMLRQRVLPLPEDAIPNFDYKLPTFELFKMITATLLEGCRNVAVLSEVQDLSLSAGIKLGGEVQQMPSWVPDYSQTMVALFSDLPGVSFDAMCGRTKRCEVDQSSAIVKVEGCLLGVVSRLAPTFAAAFYTSDLRGFIDFCLTLNDVYYNGQDRTEALLRTIIADCDGAACPADPDIRARFRFIS